MRSLKIVLDLLEHICLVGTVLAMGVMTAINIIQIIFRYLFHDEFVWIFPLTMLLFIWMTFLGAYVVYRRKKVIIVRFFVDRIPVGFQNILLAITNVFTMLFLIWILGEIPKIIQLQAGAMEVISLPRYVKAIPLFICTTAILLNYLLDTVDLIKNNLLSTN